jgi:hypothetical protein
MINTSQKKWTYGAEHELADWDTRKGWKGWGRSVTEFNICNSNGIAGDPKLIDYPFGSEINSLPTNTPQEQGELYEEFLSRHKHIFISHRIGLQIHIRMPGLKDCLPLLKQIQKYILENADVYQLVDPVPYWKPSKYPIEEEYAASRKWVQYIRRSHWTVIPENRVAKQLKAKTPYEFFKLEAPVSLNGAVMWHAQPRAAVNIRQLLQTDTIEFRFFYESLKPEQIVNAANFCRDYLQCALDNYSAVRMFKENYSRDMFPAKPTYVHWLQKRWEATTFHLNKRPEIRSNIVKILAGKFDNISNDQFGHHLKWKPTWL